MQIDQSTKNSSWLVLNDLIRESNFFSSIFARFFMEMSVYNKYILYPANGFSVSYLDFCLKNDLPLPEIMDDDRSKGFTHPDTGLKKNTVIVIVSPKYEDILSSYAKKHFPDNKIVRMGSFVSAEYSRTKYPLKMILKSAYKLRNSINLKTMDSLLHEKSVTVISRNSFSDVRDKMDVINEVSGCSFLQADSTAPQPYLANGTVFAQETDILAYVLTRRKTKKLFFFLPTFYKHYTLATLLYRFISKQVILYIYDRLERITDGINVGFFSSRYGVDERLMALEYENCSKILNSEKRLVAGIMCRDQDLELFKKCSTPYIFVPSFIPQKYHVINTKQTDDNSIVNIGVVLNKKFDSHENNNHLFMDSLYKDIIKNGCSLYLYTPASHYNRAKAYEEDIKGNFGRDAQFTANPGKPIEQLIPEIAGKYAWGLCASKGNKETINKCGKTDIPSKFNIYMALGIPVMVSEKLETVAAIVHKHQLGIVLKEDDFKNIKDIKAKLNYTRLVKNVHAYRKINSFDTIKEELANFFKKTLNPDKYALEQYKSLANIAIQKKIADDTDIVAYKTAKGLNSFSNKIILGALSLSKPTVTDYILGVMEESDRIIFLSFQNPAPFGKISEKFSDRIIVLNETNPLLYLKCLDSFINDHWSIYREFLIINNISNLVLLNIAQNNSLRNILQIIYSNNSNTEQVGTEDNLIDFYMEFMTINKNYRNKIKNALDLTGYALRAFFHELIRDNPDMQKKLNKVERILAGIADTDQSENNCSSFLMSINNEK